MSPVVAAVSAASSSVVVAVMAMSGVVVVAMTMLTMVMPNAAAVILVSDEVYVAISAETTDRQLPNHLG